MEVDQDLIDKVQNIYLLHRRAYAQTPKTDFLERRRLGKRLKMWRSVMVELWRAQKEDS